MLKCFWNIINALFAACIADMFSLHIGRVLLHVSISSSGWLRWYARISVADASGRALRNVPVNMKRVGGCEECFWEIINMPLLTYNSPKPDDMCSLILFYLDTKHRLFAYSVKTGFSVLLNLIHEPFDTSEKWSSWTGWWFSVLSPDWLPFWQKLIQIAAKKFFLF